MAAKATQNSNSFLPCCVPAPTANSNAGRINPNASRIPGALVPLFEATGPDVFNVSWALPLPLATVTAPTAQVTGGATAGVTAQVRLTVPTAKPFEGVMPMVEVADDPGAIEDVDNAESVSVKPAVTDCAPDELVLKSESPLYDAVTLFAPAVSAEEVKVATPLAFNGAVPRVVVPSRNETDPVGVPLVAGLTVAVKVSAAAPELALKLTDEPALFTT